MDNLGAIVGPLLAIVLVGLVGTRWAIGLSVIPGLLAALAIIYAIRHTARPREQDRQPIRLRIRPVLRGRLGRLMVGITAFEIGNCAATLLILRATELFQPGRSQDRATQLAIFLYVGYNVAATLISVPAGHHADRHGATRVLAIGAGCFTAAYVWFAVGPAGVVALAPAFILAGIGIGCAETAEHAAVAGLRRPTSRVRPSGCSRESRQQATFGIDDRRRAVDRSVPGRGVHLPGRGHGHGNAPGCGRRPLLARS